MQNDFDGREFWKGMKRAEKGTSSSMNGIKNQNDEMIWEKLIREILKGAF